MTKSEYYKQVNQYCSDEYFSSGSISHEETIYKCACLIDVLIKEHGELNWVREARFYTDESVWNACSYWEQLSDVDKEWIQKASDMIGYNTINGYLEIWGHIRNGWKGTIFDPVDGAKILEEIWKKKAVVNSTVAVLNPSVILKSSGSI